MCLNVLTLCVFLPQFVENVGGIEASVVTQLSGYHLQSLGECTNQQLFFASDRSRIVTQILAQLHLDRTATWLHTVALVIMQKQSILFCMHAGAVAFFYNVDIKQICLHTYRKAFWDMQSYLAPNKCGIQ